jgi:hypothetical protein
MKYKGEFILGGIFILFGLLILISNILGINFWTICWPIGLIFFGVWLLFRPQIGLPGSNARIFPLGDIKRHGEWTAEDEEIWMFVGSIKLDLTRAEIPDGTTRIRIFAFVTELDLLIPTKLDYSISVTAFISDVNDNGKKQDFFLTSYNTNSPSYHSADKKVNLEILCFVADLELNQL